MADDNSSQDAVRIERSFDAPVGLVWQMWTDPEHFAAWYGPDGATIPVASWRESSASESLGYTESMSDEHGNVMTPADMNMPKDHPTTTEVRVELEDVDGRTKMVMTHAGIPSDSPGAAGWTMALDKLAVRVDRYSNR